MQFFEDDLVALAAEIDATTRSPPRSSETLGAERNAARPARRRSRRGCRRAPRFRAAKRPTLPGPRAPRLPNRRRARPWRRAAGAHRVRHEVRGALERRETFAKARPGGRFEHAPHPFGGLYSGAARGMVFHSPRAILFRMMNRRRVDARVELEFLRATEAAAIVSGKLVGRGDKNGVDQAAVDAMRGVLGEVDIDGVVVIGEGEKDEAPMLYIGEPVGTGDGPAMDVAVDPIDGTTLASKGGHGAISVAGGGRARIALSHAHRVHGQDHRRESRARRHFDRGLGRRERARAGQSDGPPGHRDHRRAARASAQRRESRRSCARSARACACSATATLPTG